MRWKKVGASPSSVAANAEPTCHTNQPRSTIERRLAHSFGTTLELGDVRIDSQQRPDVALVEILLDEGGLRVAQIFGERRAFLRDIVRVDFCRNERVFELILAVLLRSLRM